MQDEALALLECVKALRRRRWCDGTAGNFSLTLDRTPLRLLIKPSGTDKATLSPEDLLVIDERGRPEGDAGADPSAETALHLTLASRAEAGAVLHTHSIWGTLLGAHHVVDGGFSVRGFEMQKGIAGVTDPERPLHVPVVPNSQDVPALAREVEHRLADDPGLRGFLIAGHGLYAWGRDLAEAARHVEVFEFLFELAGRRVDQWRS